MVQQRAKKFKRRLAAIMAADVAGYTRLTQIDEEDTHERFEALRVGAVRPAITEHGGRIVKDTGDGFLAEFPSPVEAVRAALQFQTRIKELTIGDAEDRRIALRVGIHVGDVIVERRDIFGDDVNIAARLESIAEPGGICISSTAYNFVRGKVGIGFAELGERSLKNLAFPIPVYAAIQKPSSASHIERTRSEAGGMWSWAKFALIALTGVGLSFADFYVSVIGYLLAFEGLGMAPVGWILAPVACTACVGGTGIYAYLFADHDRRSLFTSHFLLLWRTSWPFLSVALVAWPIVGGFQNSDAATTLLGVALGLSFARKWLGPSALPDLERMLSAIMKTFVIAEAVASILVLYSAARWDLLPNIRSLSVAFATEIVSIPIAAVVVLLGLSYALTCSAREMFSDSQFFAHPLQFVMQSRVIKRTGITLLVLFGSLSLVFSICQVLTREELIGKKCELNGIDQIVFFATGWQRDTKAASICEWNEQASPRSE
jgi:class 3 adenylate cyclase